MWPGGKDGAGIFQRLINQIPPHDVFVSAFLGDCAIMRRKLPAKVSIGVDIDRSNVHRWLAEHPLPGLQLYCACGIGWLRHRFELDRLFPDSLQVPIEDHSRSFNAAKSSVQNRPRVFVYLDPPYLAETRRSRRKLYRSELTQADHTALLETATSLPCPVMISHYPHRLYEHVLGNWRTFSFDSVTRSGHMAREQVWCNYPEPDELHDARYVGGDKRERERVRRRVRNWVAGLAKMQQAERQAVLDAIGDRWLAKPCRTENLPPTPTIASSPAGLGWVSSRC